MDLRGRLGNSKSGRDCSRIVAGQKESPFPPVSYVWRDMGGPQGSPYPKRVSPSEDCGLGSSTSMSNQYVLIN